MNDVLRTRSQAGNAMVWAIVFAILFLASGFVAYTLAGDVTRANEAEVEAKELAQAAEDGELEAIQQRLALSRAVGFRDEANTQSFSAEDAITAFTVSAKEKIGPSLGGPDTPVTLDQAAKALLQRVTTLETSLAKAEADVKAANDRAQAAQDAADQFESDYKQQIASLNQQLQDEQDRAAAQADADQQRIDDLLAANASEEDRRRQAEDELDQVSSDAAKQRANDAALLSTLGRKVETVQPEAIDGKVLEVSGYGSIAFLDIGGRDGLKNGTRFEVLRRLPSGKLTSRGFVTVEEVESDMAMASLEGEADVFDPMLPGDLVRNPHFDRGENKRYFLLGEFPLTMSREYIEQRLGELGAAVDGEIGVATDVLVLGNKNLSDEFAPELTETEEYAFATKIGMRIMRLDDLKPFLRY